MLEDEFEEIGESEDVLPSVPSKVPVAAGGGEEKVDEYGLPVQT